MIHRRLKISFSICVVLAVAISCATPIAPTGGPSDSQGPAIEKTIPETGTTNFAGREFEFQFDEFVRRASAREAITVEPDLGIAYDISWGRKSMKLEFEQDFPDSTTVIIRLETDLADTRGNNLEVPYTLAISTGDDIDGGEITGKILLAHDGSPAEEKRVLLYRQPIDLSSRANYQAQTDTGGVFTFSYLAEGDYKALLVDDRNRNKIWEEENESAYPFYEDIISLEKDGTDTLDVLYTTQVDSITPTLQGVGLFSQNRLRLRFSEDIKVKDNTEFEIVDSLENQYTLAYPLYVSPEEGFVLFAQSENVLEEGVNYRLNPEGVTDLAGNKVVSEYLDFTGTAQEDTTTQRIISANGKNGLAPDEEFRITYATPISESEVIDSLVVIEGDVDFNDWPEVSVDGNELVIRPQGIWIDGVEYQFLAWNPLTQRRKLFEPNNWDVSDYGEIEVNLQDADSTDNYYARLLGPSGEQLKNSNFNQLLTLSNLAPIRYTLIIYRDENRNEQWDRGSVIPYEAPEKYFVRQNVNVQEGFTSEINISFN
ncbi:Ig-like domain-containing protein [Gracilimonas sp.]|uniref:Ig-like domain-containing protein n=1 Tax=Gracilimonas sp. TaxID=1974203 RepID=UPI002872679A|nr:Ig-like domain-containing protein [Gracilimonas sp.]